MSGLQRTFNSEDSKMLVDCICQRHVDTARCEDSALQAAERMHQRTVGALVVVSETCVPVGILTDRDLAVRVLAAGRDASTTCVREVMTPSPKTVRESASLEQVLTLMQSGGFRRVPVVGDQGELIGMITLDDVLVWLADGFGLVGRLLERETPQAAAAP
jgi:CBS domain-containing protein